MHFGYLRPRWLLFQILVGMTAGDREIVYDLAVSHLQEAQREQSPDTKPGLFFFQPE